MTIWNSVPAGQPLGETRHDLLAIHFALGEPCSCGCGRPLTNPELHHGVLTKAHFRGIAKEYRAEILNAPCNLFLINRACHQRVPEPQHFWALACERYGEKNVRAWYRAAQAVFTSRLENYAPDRADT